MELLAGVKPVRFAHYLLVVCFVFLLSLLQAGEPRKWTSAAGKQMEGSLEAISKDYSKVLVKKGERTFTVPVLQLSEKDQAYVKERAKPFAEPKSDTFTFKVGAGKTITVAFHDTNSKVVIVMAPGATQEKMVGSPLMEMALFAAGSSGFSSAAFFTDFGPLIDHGGMKNNVYFHKMLAELRKRYRDRDFVLYGGSNGGMTIMQAVEDNKSKSTILALVASPTSYVATRGLKDLPVMFRMGAEDELGWAEHYDLIKRQMEQEGAKLNAKLIPGEGHMPLPDFEEIRAWLKTHGIVPGNSYIR